MLCIICYLFTCFVNERAEPQQGLTPCYWHTTGQPEVLFKGNYAILFLFNTDRRKTPTSYFSNGYPFIRMISGMHTSLKRQAKENVKQLMENIL